MKTGVVTRILGATLVLAAGLLALDRGVPFIATPSSLVSEAGAQAPPPLDHFQCYQAKTASGTAALPADPVSRRPSTDSASGASPSRRRPSSVPRLTSRAATRPRPRTAEHLESYQIKRVAGHRQVPEDAEPSRRRPATATHAPRPPEARAPAGAEQQEPDLAADAPPASPVTDHFTCYKVRTSPGTDEVHAAASSSRRRPIRRALGEHHEAAEALRGDQQGQRGAGRRAPSGSISLCYQVKLQSSFTPVRAYTANQFGTETLDVKKPLEVCVAAQLNPAAPTPTPTLTANITPTVTATRPRQPHADAHSDRRPRRSRWRSAATPTPTSDRDADRDPDPDPDADRDADLARRAPSARRQPDRACRSRSAAQRPPQRRPRPARRRCSSVGRMRTASAR